MKKLINRPEDLVEGTTEGIIYAYRNKIRLLDDDERILLTNYPVEQGKVGIVTAGDSNHLPIFLGYVGQGMLDGCAVDNMFASPSVKKMADMIKACGRGSDALCLYGDYDRDNTNFDVACEVVEVDDVETRTVRIEDDVASSPKETKEKRHGMIGMVYGLRVAGAATERVMSLDEVVAVAGKALGNIRTVGVTLSPYIVPQVGESILKVGDDGIEIGVGIHGERGIEVRKMMATDEVARTLMDRIAQDMSLTQGDGIFMLVNGPGAIPIGEQLTVYRCVHELLTEKGVKIIMSYIDEYATSMEMVGLSVTIFKLDEQLKELLAALTKTPFYTNLNK